MAKQSRPLAYGNNWHMDEYTVDGKRVKLLTMVRINRKRYPVTNAHIGVPYNDMGHNYTSYSTHYFVKEKVFGIEKEFDLNEIITETKVEAVEWEVE